MKTGSSALKFRDRKGDQVLQSGLEPLFSNTLTLFIMDVFALILIFKKHCFEILITELFSGPLNSLPEVNAPLASSETQAWRGGETKGHEGLSRS